MYIRNYDICRMVLFPMFASCFLKALFLPFTAACTSGCMHGVCAGDVDFWYDQVLFTSYYQILILISMHSCSICYDGSPESSFDQLIALYVIPCICRQDGLAQPAILPRARLAVIPMAATAMCLESACARLVTPDLSAPLVSFLLLIHALDLLTHVSCRGTLLEHACHIIACDCDFLPKRVGLP